MWRLLSHLIWSIGLVILVLGLFHLSIAGMPYQDPTPRQLAEQAADTQLGKIKFFGGCALFLGGLWWVALRRATRRDMESSQPLNGRNIIAATLMVISSITGGLALIGALISFVGLISIVSSRLSGALSYLGLALLFFVIALLLLSFVPTKILAWSDRVGSV